MLSKNNNTNYNLKKNHNINFSAEGTWEFKAIHQNHAFKNNLKNYNSCLIIHVSANLPRR